MVKVKHGNIQNIKNVITGTDQVQYGFVWKILGYDCFISLRSTGSKKDPGIQKVYTGFYFYFIFLNALQGLSYRNV